MVLSRKSTTLEVSSPKIGSGTGPKEPDPIHWRKPDDPQCSGFLHLEGWTAPIGPAFPQGTDGPQRSVPAASARVLDNPSGPAPASHLSAEQRKPVVERSASGIETCAVMERFGAAANNVTGGWRCGGMDIEAAGGLPTDGVFGAAMPREPAAAGMVSMERFLVESLSRMGSPRVACQPSPIPCPSMPGLTVLQAPGTCPGPRRLRRPMPWRRPSRWRSSGCWRGSAAAEPGGAGAAAGGGGAGTAAVQSGRVGAEGSRTADRLGRGAEGAAD